MPIPNPIFAPNQRNAGQQSDVADIGRRIADDLPLFGPGGLGLDSIDALELVVSMEKKFGVGVPNSEVASKALQTVNSMHDYIIEKTELPRRNEPPSDWAAR